MHPTGPMPAQPGPFAPKPPSSNASGCSTALVVVGVIFGVIVLAVIIVLIAAAKGQQKSNDQYSGAPAPASIASVLPAVPGYQLD
ncbi:hypothetical protein GCM10025734_44360 [Kitasatospora paranensis]